MSEGEQNIRKGETRFIDSRKKADWVTHMATILSAVSWVIAAIVWFVLDQAQPEKAHMFTRYFDVAVRESWNYSFIPLVLVLLNVSLLSCVAAFIFNVLRKRRKTDKYKKSVIIIGLITLVGMVVFLVRFWDLI